jgi:tRNA (adenine57-N1/adenine58-N1)-methyltransferase
MHGHTGFLISTRRLAPGVTPPLRKRRPAKGVLDGDTELPTGDWSLEDMGELATSEKKIRRVRRSLTDRPTT